jgi:2'-5' RNA ligase
MQTEVGGSVNEAGLRAEDEDQWGASNKLKKINPHTYRPFEDLQWNRDNSMYSEQAYGKLSLRRVKHALTTVCAYCQSLLNTETGEKTPMSAEEYSSLMQNDSQVSHGMCKECYAQQQAELAAYKARKQAARKFDKATIQTDDIPPDVEAVVRDLQKTIDKDILYKGEDEEGWIEGGLQQLLHITVLYGIDTKDLDKIEEELDKAEEMPIKLNKLEYFDSSPEYTVAVIRCNSTSLTALSDKLRDLVPNEQHDGEYKPHITVAYLKKGEKLANEDIPKIEWAISNIQVSKPDGEVEDLTDCKENEPKIVVVEDITVYITKAGYDMRNRLAAEESKGSLNAEGTLLLQILNSINDRHGIKLSSSEAVASSIMKKSRLGTDNDVKALLDKMLTSWGWLSPKKIDFELVETAPIPVVVEEPKPEDKLASTLEKVLTKLADKPEVDPKTTTLIDTLASLVDKLTTKVSAAFTEKPIIEEVKAVKTAETPKQWRFDIKRGKEQRIESILAARGEKKYEFHVERGEDSLMTGISAEKIED